MRIDHIMLPVAEIERSIAFYCETFNMALVSRREDSVRRFAHMGYGPRGEHATIELIEQSGAGCSVGDGHFCIHLVGLRGWVEAQEALGRTFVRPHGLRDGCIARAWIRDPDGHLIEVAEG